jgi:RNA polymerase sigma factor (sigma-70 family)
MESRPDPAPARRDELEARFLAALPLVERTVRFIARRHRLSEAEAEEFASEAKLALIDNGYAILARFEGRSALGTYLSTVLQRLFLDRRRKTWGKWCPSAAARRLGPTAVRLESLLYRDGLSVAEACEMLHTNHRVPEAPEALRELAARLPVRERRSGETIDVEVIPEPAASPSQGPEERVAAAATARRCQAALDAAVRALAPDDRVVLRLRFEDGLSVADIARGMRRDQKQLYRRLDATLAGLRAALEREGLTWHEIAALIERGECHLRLPGGESGPARTSNLEAMT